MDAHPLIKHISAYLKGHLPAETTQAVEDAIAADPAFAKEVESQRDLMVALRALGSGGIQDQTAMLQQAPAQVRPPGAPWPRILLIVAAIGAVILLLAGINRLLHANATERLLQSVPEDKISQNLLEDKQASLALGGWNPITDTLLAGMEAYQAQDFESAKRLISTYLATYPSDEYAIFYLGICHLQLDQADEAGDRFQQLYHDKKIGARARQFLDALEASAE